MPTAPSEPSAHGCRQRRLGYLLGAIVVPTLYVLSAAPVLRFCAGKDWTSPHPDTFCCLVDNVGAPEPWQIVYEPTLRLAECRSLQPLAMRWFDLMGVRRRLFLTLVERGAQRTILNE